MPAKKKPTKPTKKVKKPATAKRLGIPRKVLSIANVRAALVKHRGNISAVGRKFKVTRAAVANFIAYHHDELHPVLVDARETLVDTAVDKLGEAVDDREPWAINMVLTTIGKERGYGKEITLKEKVELEIVEDIVSIRQAGEDAGEAKTVKKEGDEVGADHPEENQSLPDTSELP